MASSSRSLWTIGWRYVQRHVWQSVLMIIGIALGVAVVVAIDMANASASRAFDISTDAIAGRATHQIVGGPSGLDEELYVQLRRAGIVRAAAPIVSEYVSSPQLGDRPMQLLGIDPLAEGPFRSYLSEGKGEAIDLAAFLTQPGALLVSSDVASRYGLAQGERITLDIAGDQRGAILAGLLYPADSINQRALDGLILADISTAQEMTGRTGRLDRIDLILREDDTALMAQISALLPASARVIQADARKGTVQEMTDAFRTNLTALSLLALVVGMLLIYNTMTFSVVQRRAMFGTLRCLGVTQREVFALVLGEALLVGMIGAGLGVLLGIVMGQGTLRMVMRTINDIYFVVTVSEVRVPAVSLVKGEVLGVVATVVSAALPAREAASVPPRAALSRSGLETKVRGTVSRVALAGLALLACGAALLSVPTRSLVISLGGTFAVVIGFAMLAPFLTTHLMRAVAPLTGRVWGLLGRMAPRSVVSSLSRTSIAIAALMVAVSVTIGVSLMISSFRHTVILWLEQTLQGDIYVFAPGLSGAPQNATLIDPRALEVIAAWPGVGRVDELRTTQVDSPEGLIVIDAVTNPDYAKERVFLWNAKPQATIWDAMLEGEIIVSEPLANRLGLSQRRNSLTLYTDAGPRDFRIIGVYHDYGSPEGAVSMSLNTYRQSWNDPEAVTALALRLEPGYDTETVARQLEDAVSPLQRLFIRPNRALRGDALVIFDRTFAITDALQLLATIVAFIGVLSALLSLQMEKQREFGVLRAVGLTIRQVWSLIMLETGLMGAAAGVLAIPTGYALSLILIYIINRRAFGWTLQMQVEPAPFVRALVIALAAALIAGVYPAYRMGRTLTAEALRSE